MHYRNSFRLLTMATAMALPMAAPCVASAAVSFVMSVNIAPPALPIYAQPVCPGPGYLWTPGYWAYGPHGYLWMAGAWVRPPAPGMLWTPAWWGWEGGHYRFHAGYWGPHVGYYGGVRYGFGYPGTGFEGGEWRGHDFFYNSAVTHVDEVHMRNLYRKEHHFDERDRDRRSFYEGDHRGPVVEEHGRPAEVYEHHDQGNHNGWAHDDHHDNGNHNGWAYDDHHDNGNHNGWDHEDHGNGHGHDKH